jgi:hypothetical protein
MSTPVEQYVPPEFQQTIDLVTNTPVDQAAAGAAQRRATAARFKAAQGKAAVSAAEARLRTAKTTEQKRAAQIALKTAQYRESAYQAAATATQNAYYRASGQYEKLLTGASRDAFAALQTMFNRFGLGSLAGKIYDYAKQGYGADTITLLLQDTPEFKQRFAANDARIKAGLPALNPQDYLNTEDAYRQVLQDAGLPKGFYDNPADFQKWIAGGVSPTEIKNRVDVATAETVNFDAVAKQQLALYYGIDESHLVAYALDPTKAVPVLQKEAAAAQFGAEAARRGLATDRTRMESYISQGLSQSQAAQGFQIVAQELPNLNAIAARFGTTFGQVQEEQAVFGTAAESANARQRLISQERSLFGTAQGASPGGLSVSYQQT